MSLLKKSQPRKPDKKQFLDDPFAGHEEDRVGNINQSLFYYVTPGMIGITAGVILIVGLNWGNLQQNFETNVALNGSIIGMMIFALIKAFYGNFRLYRTARFIMDIDAVAEKDTISQNDADRLANQLETRGDLLNIKNMSNAIGNLVQFGGLNFSDKDAMLIKSKFGYRVRNERAAIGFIAGILVMMGLLGTFLGLLKTIDAVGAALGTMGAIGGGEGGDDAMGGFISSLAAPLQGMGLAFSSSLFGLSGSLLIGYFNHLCAGAQNKFIEDVSRWIDNRIPSLNPTIKKEAKKAALPPGDDLKPWLTGFVYLSVKTHQKMAALFTAMSENTSASHALNQKTDLLCEYNKEIKDSVAGLNSYIENIQSNSTLVAGKIDQMGQSFGSMSSSVQDLSARVARSQEITQGMMKGVETGFGQVVSTLQSSHQSSQALVSAVRDQNTLATKMDAGVEGMKEQIVDQNQYLRSKVSPLLEVTQTMGTDLRSLSSSLSKADKVNKTLIKRLEKQEQGFEKVMEQAVAGMDATSKLNKTVTEHASVLEQGLQGLNQNSQVVNDNITGSVEKFGSVVEGYNQKFGNDVSRLATQFERMNALFEDMQKSQMELANQVSSLKEAVQLVESKEQINEVSGLVQKLVQMVQSLLGREQKDNQTISRNDDAGER